VEPGRVTSEPSKRGIVRPVSSLQNDRIKLVRSLELRKARRETGLFVAEGAALLVAARDAGWKPEMLLFRAGTGHAGVTGEILEWALDAGAECLEVTEAVQAKVASKDNPQTVIGVFSQRWIEPSVMLTPAPHATWIVLEEVRDPGNLGTILRTADAAGAAGIALAGTCCDPFSSEAVRASMGSVFALPLVRLTLDELRTLARGWHGDVVATHLDATADFRQVTYRDPALLVMGSEGPGLSDATAAVCTLRVKIPMAGRLDSLNLAVATALVIYEIRKKRLTL